MNSLLSITPKIKETNDNNKIKHNKWKKTSAY